MTTFLYITITLFTIVSVFMILLILIQKGRGGGLASAFGGAGGNTAFGAKTGDVLTWATSVVFGIFLILAITMNLIAKEVNIQRTVVPGAATPAQTNTTPADATPAGTTPAAAIPSTNPVTPPATNQP